jgi:beta-fructofuranosidase
MALNRRKFLGSLAAAPLRAAECNRLANDPHRPQYHLLAPANWLNDPNGPIFWKGKHHIFYQHNPKAPYHGPIHWGHAVSEDLVHWKHLPIALVPGPGAYDAMGCWTGSAVNDNGTPTFVYSGVSKVDDLGYKLEPETQCIATGDDDLLVWKKEPDNPVVAASPPGLDVAGFRDPTVWREPDGWYMLVGSGIKGVGGTVFLYRSPDLRKWDYMHQMLTGEEKLHRRMWECPDFFKLGGCDVLIINGGYFTGKSSNHKLQPEYFGKTEYGSSSAPKTFVDGTGRRIYVSWVNERRTREARIAAGWAGAISLPRVLTLGKDNQLRMEPVPELDKLRGRPVGYRNLDVSGERELKLGGISGECLEIRAEIDPGNAAECGVRVRCAPDGTEHASVFWKRSGSQLASQCRSPEYSAQSSGPLPCEPGEAVVLRIFVDGSVVETFANSRAVLTQRVYPTRGDSIGVRLFTTGGSARFRRVKIWPIRPISPDRLTSGGSYA